MQCAIFDLPCLRSEAYAPTSTRTGDSGSPELPSVSSCTPFTPTSTPFKSPSFLMRLSHPSSNTSGLTSGLAIISAIFGLFFALRSACHATTARGTRLHDEYGQLDTTCATKNLPWTICPRKYCRFARSACLDQQVYTSFSFTNGPPDGPGKVVLSCGFGASGEG